ncbi:MAG: hypothetical protein R3195_15505 [Gemmatimonadota bacterium]|nr:hypothetical protein [Gemmatimonadota bacterium]
MSWASAAPRGGGAVTALVALIAGAGGAHGQSVPVTPDTLPGRFAGDGTVIGLEYALLDNPRVLAGMAEAFAATGLTGMKHHVEAVQWGEMQSGPDEDIDFEKLDGFVREYQRRGFTELTVSLRPHSRWASKDVRALTSTNGSPKPEYEGLFREWVSAVVERYDADGVDDLEGLRWPVRYVEIGNELSSYQPEPVGEYLRTLEIAYEAAHAAYPDVLIGHAAFLFAPVGMEIADPSAPDDELTAAWDEAWANTPRVDNHHDLDDMRAILDRPDIFDFINFHNLGEPYEIEHVMRWIGHETASRGYEKPVVISDTTPTSYIGWGAADRCTGAGLGLLGSPATREDRCRLAEFFTRLLERDAETLAWTRGFVAADHVQRVIIAAERGVRLINLAFVTDIPWLTMPAMHAGAGIAAWGGAIRINPWTGRVLDRYPPFHAIRQLMTHVAGHTAVERVPHDEADVRIYRVAREDGPVAVAWLDPGRALTPDMPAASRGVALDLVALGLDARVVEIEPVITEMGRSEATGTTQRASDGAVEVELTHAPVYITARGASRSGG